MEEKLQEQAFCLCSEGKLSHSVDCPSSSVLVSICGAGKEKELLGKWRQEKTPSLRHSMDGGAPAPHH